MPGTDGIELVRQLAKRGSPLPVILISGHADIPMAVAAIKAGAEEFIEKPVDDNTTADGRGVLGPIAGIPGLFVAVPGDAGYTLGPLSARLVADMALGRKPGEDVSDFLPGRFGAAA